MSHLKTTPYFLIVLLFFLDACGDSVKDALEKSNNKPEAADDYFSTYRNTAINLDVIVNDSDLEHDPINVIEFNGYQLGDVGFLPNDSNQIVYTPHVDISGTDAFTYSIKDNTGKTAQGKIIVEISPWSSPKSIGNGDDVSLASGENGIAVATWVSQSDSTTISTNRYVPRLGWESDPTVLTSGNVSDPRLSVDQNGNPIVMWKESVGAEYLVKSSTWADEWLMNTLLISTTEPRAHTLVQNAAGHSLVAWVQSDPINNFDIWAGHYKAFGPWQGQTAVGATAQNEEQPSIAMDGKDNAVLVWTDQENGNILWAYRSDCCWVSPSNPQINDQTASQPRIKLNEAGLGIVTWTQFDAEGRTHIVIRAIDTHGLSTEPELSPLSVIDNGNGTTGAMDLDVSKNGNLAIVWQQTTETGSEIWIYSIIGIERKLEKINLGISDIADYPNVAVDDQGTIYVLWQSENGIETRRYSNNQWSVIEILRDTENSVGFLPHVETSANGWTLAVWQHSDGSIWSSNAVLQADLPMPVDHNAVSVDGCTEAGCHELTSTHIETTTNCHLCHINTTWYVNKVSHVDTTAPCIKCHNGAVSKGIPNLHPYNSPKCEYCHNTDNWIQISFNHDGIVTDCNDCHNRPFLHIISTNNCGACHTTTSWTQRKIDHNETTAPCLDCHQVQQTRCFCPNVVYCENCHNSSQRWIFTTSNCVPPPQGMITFSSNRYLVGENGNEIQITVGRLGGSAGTVSIDFKILGSSAVEGIDYIATSGTLTFLEGEISKIFVVSILDDLVVDGDKTLGFYIDNPTGGAIVGLPDETIITIVDNDV